MRVWPTMAESDLRSDQPGDIMQHARANLRLSAAIGFILLSIGLGACSRTEPEAAAAAAPSGKADVDGARIENADSEPGSWMSHGRTYSEQRFSPLTQITKDNVGTLGLAWFADLDTQRGQEATPLVVDGVIYVSTAWSKVKAYDARTGNALWAFDPKVPGETGVNACCDVVNRGVAVWKGKVFVGTIDGRLIALDATNGNKLWDVDHGRSDQAVHDHGRAARREGQGAHRQRRRRVRRARLCRRPTTCDTGEIAWRFYTVPGNPADGFETADARNGREDVERRVVDDRRRRHGVGFDVLRPRASTCSTSASATAAPWNRRCAARARATTCSSRRSSR